MQIEKLEVSIAAETATIAEEIANWLQANDTQPIWVLRQIVGSVLNNMDAAKQAIIWKAALIIYYTAEV